MSTISDDNITNDGVYVYTKGSPEQMLKMSVFDPKSVPSNYNDVLRKYASMGFRVLAIGHKKILKKEQYPKEEKGRKGQQGQSKLQH